MKFYNQFAVAFLTTSILAACGSSDGSEDPGPEQSTNVAPTHSGDLTFTLTESDNPLVIDLLDGTSDADNDTLTYRWVVNGATVTLTGSTTDTVTFTAPDVASATELTVRVFVTDGIEEVSSESRTVTVNNVDVVEPPKEKSSGGSFGYLIFLLAGLRFFRR